MGNGSSIGKVRGLGSAHSGAHHWLLQRYTAVGNLVLGLWLLFSLMTMQDYKYQTMAEWATRPVSAVALALFVISTFWHARVGLQVVVEDYVHEHANKFACVVLLNLAAFAGVAACLFFLARLEIVGAASAISEITVKSALQSMTGGR
jgi:succinate dehydrogenase / fumarate reductase, membrane anchor subunit